MKKILLIPALLFFISCQKEHLEPDPLPEPTTSDLGYDTTTKTIYGTWTSFYYKYKRADGYTEMQTFTRDIQITSTEFKIDNSMDGIYETIYPLNKISDKIIGLKINDTIRAYEVTSFRDEKNVMGYQIASAGFNNVSIKKDGQVFYLNRKTK